MLLDQINLSFLLLLLLLLLAEQRTEGRRLGAERTFCCNSLLFPSLLWALQGWSGLVSVDEYMLLRLLYSHLFFFFFFF
jgi:hypothetical protein